MDNLQIAKTLEQLADLMEFQGANAFRLRAYRNGSKIIRDCTRSICEIINSGEALTDMEGIGKSVAQKCSELCESGRLQQLDDLLEEVPHTVLDLLKIPKLGPKKAAVLFNEMGIVDLEQLKAACEAGEVQKLSGFAVKTEQAILEGIEIAVAAGQRILWAEADRLVERLRKHMLDCSSVDSLEFAGSYRRGKETVGDLDMLITSTTSDEVMDHFRAFPDVENVIARGETKMSVRTGDGFQIDLRVVPAESFGAALQYFTGSKEHNVVIRGLAKQAGLRVNEWGIFKTDGDDQERVGGESEQDIYAALGLPVFEPELRENRREFEWAKTNDLPNLIAVEHIQGDLHMHTTATDGSATIEAMANAAREINLKFIAITDHSKRVAMANGLDEERLLQQWAEIDRINECAEDSFVVLKGIECDILENGDMDLPDSLLSRADWVVASLHYGQHQPRQQITDRIVGALENEFVSMVAHPTGRLINKRKPYDVDMTAVFQAAVSNQKFLELNASPKRLDLHDVHLIAAVEQGIPIVINTDAHHPAGLLNMRFGIKQARRAGLQVEHVANAWSWAQMQAKLGRG